MTDQLAGEHPLVKVEHLAEFFPITGGILQRKVGEVKAVREAPQDLPRNSGLELGRSFDLIAGSVAKNG